MEPVDFQNPYGDKLVRKKKHRKNKVVDQVDNELRLNANNAINNEIDKIGLHDEEDYIMDMVYLNRKASETKSKETADDADDNEDKLPVLPKPMIIDQIPKQNQQTKSKKNVGDTNDNEDKAPVLPNPMIIDETPKKNQQKDDIKPKKEKISKLTIILLVIIAVLAVLVIVLLVLTIVFGVQSSEAQKSTSTTTAPLTPCAYGFSGPDCSDQCGLSFFSGNLRITGGWEASAHSWPSIILIEFKYKFDYNYSGNTYTKNVTKTCAATLINRNTALTAAHCLVEYVNFTEMGNTFYIKVATNNYHSTFESMYSAYLGVHDLVDVFAQSFLYPARKVSVMSFIRHPQFDASDFRNDIAVIKLRSSVTLDNYVQLSCLPKNSIYSSGEDVWTAGWGDISESSSAPAVFELQNAKLTLYEMNDCYNVSIGLYKNPYRQICAGDINGSVGVCNGDEGGPLFVKDDVNGEQRYVLIGITSYFEGCGRPGLPAIFTNVTNYLDWIDLYF